MVVRRGVLTAAAAFACLLSVACNRDADERTTAAPEFAECPTAIPTPLTDYSETLKGLFSEACVRELVSLDFRLPDLRGYERPVFGIEAGDLSYLTAQYEPIDDTPRLLLEMFPADRANVDGDLVTATNGTQVFVNRTGLGIGGGWKRAGVLYVLHLLDAPDDPEARALITNIVDSFPE
jgi:hypothetical protein